MATTTTQYLGVDTREHHSTVDQDDHVVLAFTHEYHGRLRFPLEVSEAEQLAEDVDSAINQLLDHHPLPTPLEQGTALYDVAEDRAYIVHRVWVDEQGVTQVKLDHFGDYTTRSKADIFSRCVAGEMEFDGVADDDT